MVWIVVVLTTRHLEQCGHVADKLASSDLPESFLLRTSAPGHEAATCLFLKDVLHLEIAITRKGRPWT